MRRIATASGAKILLSLGDEEGEEQVTSEMLGTCDEVYEEKVGDQDFILLKNIRKCQSIVLRGANENMLDEIERSLHDSVCMVKRVLEN